MPRRKAVDPAAAAGGDEQPSEPRRSSRIKDQPKAEVPAKKVTKPRGKKVKAADGAEEDAAPKKKGTKRKAAANGAAADGEAKDDGETGPAAEDEPPAKKTKGESKPPSKAASKPPSKAASKPPSKVAKPASKADGAKPASRAGSRKPASRAGSKKPEDAPASASVKVGETIAEEAEEA